MAEASSNNTNVDKQNRNSDESEVEQPKELPNELAEFGKYVGSNCCYYFPALEKARFLRSEQKFAYQCDMKVLFEERTLRTNEEPHPWSGQGKTFLGSYTLGMMFCENPNNAPPVGNIWTDYQFDIPEGDKHSLSYSIDKCRYVKRCSWCSGRGIKDCSSCGGRGLSYGDQRCSSCNGSGKERCSTCKGYGGLLCTPILCVSWHSRDVSFVLENSYLPEKRIRKAKKSLHWSCNTNEWNKEYSIQNIVSSVVEETPDIDLRMAMMRNYHEKIYNPEFKKNNVMRRLRSSVEILRIQEVYYTLGDEYTNQKESKMEHEFRFCQYSGPKGELTIYEDDYPLNCCGCCGPKMACYSCCCNCTIL